MCVAKVEVYKQQRAELLWNFHSRSRQRAIMMDFANCAGLWLNATFAHSVCNQNPTDFPVSLSYANGSKLARYTPRWTR